MISQMFELELELSWVEGVEWDELELSGVELGLRMSTRKMARLRINNSHTELISVKVRGFEIPPYALLLSGGLSGSSNPFIPTPTHNSTPTPTHNSQTPILTPITLNSNSTAQFPLNSTRTHVLFGDRKEPRE